MENKRAEWRPLDTECPGQGVALAVEVPTGDEDRLHARLRLRVFHCPDNALNARWRAHASIDGSEIFRHHYSTLELATDATITATRRILNAFLGGLPEEEENFPRCGECGGTVRLRTAVGRTREFKRGVHLTIPADFGIPTCLGCGEESMTLEISERLDAILVKHLSSKKKSVGTKPKARKK